MEVVDLWKAQLEIYNLLRGGGIGDLCQAQRFDLRFLRPFRADLSIRKSSSFFPPLMAATSQRGLAPRPAQVSPEGERYFGGTFLPFNDELIRIDLPLAGVSAANCFSSSARSSSNL
jgi:hypothetical protein